MNFLWNKFTKHWCIKMGTIVRFYMRI